MKTTLHDWITAAEAWLQPLSYSDTVGTIGVLISVIGFAASLWQIRKTRSATVATQKAIVEAQSRVASVDAVSEMSSTVQALNALKTCLNSARMNEMIELINNARRSILIVREGVNWDSEDDQKVFNLTLEFLEEIEVIIRRTDETDMQSAVNPYVARLVGVSNAFQVLQVQRKTMVANASEN